MSKTKSLRLAPNLLRSPRMLRFERMVGQVNSFGYLVRFWLWLAEQDMAPVLPEAEAPAIFEAAAGWGGIRGELFQKAADCGFLVHVVDGYSVADWGAISRRPASTVEGKAQVYFIRAVNGGPIKIGSSLNPAWRLRELQTGAAYELAILVAIPGSAAVERQLHQRFASLRLGGEWFSPGGDLLALIDSLKKGGKL